MSRLILLTFSGLADGAVYALIALGFVLIYNSTGIINFAQGDLVTLGAYLTWWLHSSQDVGLVLSAIIAIAVMAVIGVALERLAAAPLRNASMHVAVIATLGAAMVIRAGIIRWQGTAPKRLPGPFGFRIVEIAGARIPIQDLLVIGGSLVCLVSVWLILHKTSFGRKVRALAADRETARLVGIRVGVLSMTAFALSAAIAGIAGILIGPTQQLTPGFGFGPMLFAFAAAILGGFGRIEGVAIAAIAMGVLQQLLTGYFNPDWRDVYPFIVMLVILAFRPHGIFAERIGQRV